VTTQLTRRAFVGALGAGAAALAVGPTAHAATDPAGDAAILNHALALEHLQAALYTRAARVPALGPTVARMTEAMGGVERAHVAALTEALGDAALAPPLFDVTAATADEKAFIAHAVAVEDLVAATHLHHLPRLTDPALRDLLASIHTVDAGHAAWIRLLAGVTPVTEAIDRPVDASEATRLLIGSGLVRPRPGSAPGGEWSAEGRPGLLAAFPLGRRPATDPVSTAPRPRPGTPAAVPEAEDRRWGLWVATTAGISAIVLGGLGLRARRDTGPRVTVVGPDEGPVVVQHAGAPGGVAGGAGAPQTAGVPAEPHTTRR
jgi:hypothetical protein